MTVKLFDADTFAPISSWSTSLPSPMWFVAASDDGVAVSSDNKASFAYVDHPWRTLFTGAKDPILSLLSVNFANNDVLLMTRGNRVIGVDRGGAQLFQTELNPKQFSLATRSSRGGHAFMAQTDDFLLAYQSQFAIPASMATAPDEIGVYDSRNGHAIFHRSVLAQNERPIGSIAISPDANFVAVLSGGLGNQTDGTVEVFRIPQVDGVN
jgi:WD40 repeat protein